MLSEGQMVGNYRVLRELGHGGMGAVYCAEHQYIGRRAAIKVLHPELSENPAFAARFLNEARAVNLVQHPGLVEIFEYGVLPDGSAFIIMEYLEGDTLRDRIQRRPISYLHGAALPIAHQIAQALSAAHQREIVHRDLKPDNVMLIPDRQRAGEERVKVLDFGLAKMTAPQPGSDSGPKTGTGVTMGTAEYMSPEQCKAQPLDGQTDTYALGVMLYEMLAGQLPFRGEFAFDLMRLHVYEKPRPLREIDPTIPEGAATLAEAMLAKDPAARPSMNEVVARIERLCPDLSLYASSANQMDRSPLRSSGKLALAPTLPETPSTAPASVVATTAGQPAKGQGGRRLLAVQLGLLVLAVGGGVFAWRVFGGRGDSPVVVKPAPTLAPVVPTKEPPGVEHKNDSKEPPKETLKEVPRESPKDLKDTKDKERPRKPRGKGKKGEEGDSFLQGEGGVRFKGIK